jgi:hypothetical protein
MISRLFPFVFFSLVACGGIERKNTGSNEPLVFQQLHSWETGIEFSNTLMIRQDFDVFRYHNFYNGGGVGIADFNNDGLADVYLTSNMGDNKLYLNKGNWKFTDITDKAGVKGSKMWSTGVSIADINHDGFLDIYVSNAGDIKGTNRENELFINNGNLTFTEKASDYGLADKGFSTHAVFFDFDKDGDLDCYVLNNSYRPVSSLGYRNLRHIRDEFGGHKLYRNDSGKYVDISAQAGIYGSVIGFGLGVAVGDVNHDNWPDLYVSNDFYERDYLYINNHDGTFAEKLESYMGHISMFSMGADMADLNNDGYPEIFSTDMLPHDDYRLKTLTSFEPYDVYQLRLKNDYYHQFMRNMLHINNGDGTFTEIGQMAGVDATDWSWGALIADFNNDLHKEIYVCNGIYKDVTNQDFVEFLGSGEQMRAVIEGREIDYQDLIERMPSVKLSNYMFKPTGDGRYQNVSADWGLAEPSFSNGAAYGDLDNDGDLDLVVNNVNQEAFVFKNQTNELSANRFLTLTFKGTGQNSFGIGANVKVYTAGEIVAQDNMPMRGFQSSMDYKMVIGLGTRASVDSLIVTWPDDKRSILKSVAAGEHLTIEQKDARMLTLIAGKKANSLLREIDIPAIVHEENDYNDFDRDRLLYHVLSTQGPAFAIADLNGDGTDDFYLGGSIGGRAQLYLQQDDTFIKVHSDELDIALSADDTDAVFFDADGDKDLDLYVVSGGSENLAKTTPLLDRFYENTGMKNGVPVLKSAENKIPALYQSGSCVRPADVDRDGDIDLFVGTRGIPAYYGLPADQFLLINDGSGNFTESSAAWAPQFSKLGMVTDALWFDYNRDDLPDLIVVGEWMPVTIFLNDGKRLRKNENIKGLEDSDGLWNRIKEADLDKDGDVDFVLGNLGRNSKFRPSGESPITLYVNDFDENGSIEPIFAYEQDGVKYPFALRQDLIKQMSGLKKKFVYYKDYAGHSITEIFDEEILEQSPPLNFSHSATSVLINEGDNTFLLTPLHGQAQVAPVYGIAIEDIDNDNHLDIILGGNLFGVKPEVGRYDALRGLILKGNGNGDFQPLTSFESGLNIEGEVRHIALLRGKSDKKFAFVRNDNSLKLFDAQKR